MDFMAQVDAWCGGIQPDPHDSATREAVFGSPFAAAATSLLEKNAGNFGATSGRPSASAHLTRHIASAPFRDHDMPRPFILAAPTWALVHSMVPMDSFGNTTQPALFSMYFRRSRTLSRRLASLILGRTRPHIRAS